MMRPAARSTIVYALCSRSTGKVYVGKTLQPSTRMAAHKSAAKHGYDSYLARAIRKYGWHDFVVVILASGLTNEEACDLEIGWIADLNLCCSDCGYNLSMGGEGSPGRKTGKALMASRHNAMKARSAWSRIHSQEHKQQVSEMNRRHWQDSERREKLLKALSRARRVSLLKRIRWEGT